MDSLPVMRIFKGLFLILAGALPLLAAETVILRPSGYYQEKFQDEMYSISCEAKNATSIEWFKPGPSETFFTDKRTSDIFVEKIDDGNILQLRFQKLKMRDSGVYTCVARVNNRDEKKTFNLTVIRSISFADKNHVFYAEIGGSATLYCEADAYPAPSISWTREERKIEGPDFRILADGLCVLNVTEDKLGNYTCSAVLITSNNGVTKSIDLVLKLARPPKIKPLYKNNVVIGVINNFVSIRCQVSADPSAEIKWLRNGKELSLREYNATIQNKDNESILQLYLSRPDLVGEYVCNATNSLKSTIKVFTLKEGQAPDVPTVQVRGREGNILQLDITPNNTQELNHYRVLYKKVNEANTSDWTSLDLELKNSSTNPYWVNDLQSSTTYLYKVGACSHVDLCTYTEESNVYIEPIQTGSANTIHAIVTQALILLPAFVLNFITQRYQT